jgi:arylsulfatase A-like enzyme
VGWEGALDPHISPEQTRLAWGADRVIDLLTAYAEADAPFYVEWDTNEPHLPSVLPEPYFSMVAPQAVAPWPGYPDALAHKPYAQAQQRRSWQVEDWTWADWAPVVALYLGTIALLDAQVGRLLAALERLGLAEETMVVYTTDHGDMCGAHGMFDKHMVLYEDVVHVPLIVRWPQGAVAGATCDAFVSHAIDLATTLCEAAGAPVPATFRGTSLLPMLAGTGSNGRTDILSMYHGNQFGLYSQRMVRDRRWKYVWNATAEDELYDLDRDPGELHNVAADLTAAGPLARLRARLVVWMEAIDDPLLNAWTRRQLLEGLSV